MHAMHKLISKDAFVNGYENSSGVYGKRKSWYSKKVRMSLIKNIEKIFVIIMYTHLVQYYETDKMGVTHHSNYIRWMEEARISFLEESGWSFSRLEAEGLVSPVISLKCDYRKPTTFSDSVDIEVGVKEMKGIKVVLSYTMKKGNDIVCEAESTHCFMRKDGHVMRIEREMPEFSAFVSSVMQKDDSATPE